MTTTATASPIEAFIARWAASSGAERANFHGFVYELCDLIGVGRPDPANQGSNADSYRFECPVKFKQPDGSESSGSIDLYKRGSFVMEAKQSREKGRPKELKMAGQPDLFTPDYKPRGQRGANRAWDQLMINARHQAQDYARALPVAHGWPPFVIVCDVGHCIEVYADFSGQGKNYAQFPDRQSFRIFLSDLKDEKVRERLKLIWESPATLDPVRQSAEVTRDISARLAQVSKRLEDRGHNAEDVALFLMRCLFTMFAEDVELLPKDSFSDLLERCKADPSKFPRMVEQLWTAMDKGDFAFAIEQTVRRFNGKLFKDAKALPLEREDIGELHAAAKRDWRKVEPAIFGTLLEQALNPKERAKLGAHYTPRAYVERLVFVTVIEPLRHEWSKVQATAERLKIEADQLATDAEDRARKLKTKDQRELDAIRDARSEAKRTQQQAIDTIHDFHKKLCATRVLDPACGTGNFLYVAMELMKRLEGEVLESLADMGGQEALALDKLAVDPHQFLGLELNPRAAAIAELVIWLGYLQWHFRTKGGQPAEPILRDFKNINFGKPGGYDAVMTWDGYPRPHVEVRDGRRVETYPNARRPAWPEAEFIVGNPPFIGGGGIRASLGGAYTEALWSVHKDINDSADLVMYWWDRAAGELTRAKSPLQRFGFVTTNSVSQSLSGGRVIARHLSAKKPISILMAIADHPWTKATDKAAAVRIAMTVAVPGRVDGVLREVTREAKLDTDQPQIEFAVREGYINSDLSLGVDVTAVEALVANNGIAHDGVKLHGKGFIVTQYEAEALGLGNRDGLDQHIRPYRNGRDLAAQLRGVLVIDLFGLEAELVRKKFPEVYQHLLLKVKPERDRNNRATYRDNWWLFGEPRRELRPALSDLKRYVATVDTARHRVFQFLDSSLICDDKVVVVASSDAFDLGILSSSIHVIWSLRAGGWLGVGNDSVYVKTRCFDPYPFPDCSEDLKERIRDVAEELDAHRKARQAEHPRLTLTQMYNVLEKLTAGEALDADDERIKAQGLVLILKELHDKLDALVFEAYGWPATLTDEEILERLVALNKKRSLEEKVGNIKWLRPDYQIPRFGSDAERARLEAERRAARDTDKLRPRQGALELEDDLQEMMPADASKARFPTGSELAETAAVMSALAAASGPTTVEQIARMFSQGKQVEKRVALTLLALARLGHIAMPSETTFVLRRAA